MAQPYGSPEDFTIDAITAAGKFVMDSGIRAIDMHPDLINMSPQVGRAFTMLGETDAESINPRWERQTLAPIDESDAYPAGADYAYVDPNIPTQKENVTRLFRKTAQVTGESLVDKYHAPIGDIKTLQTNARMREIVRDMNWAVYNSRLVNSSEATARRFRGIRESLARAGNLTKVGGPLTSSLFKDTMLRGVRDDGFDPKVVVTSEGVQSVIDGFAFGATLEVDITKKQRYSWVNEVMTPFGSVKLMLEYDMFMVKSVDDTALLPGGVLPTNDVEATYGGANDKWIFALDTDYWKIAWFRRTFMEEPARDGDRWRGVIMAQFTLKDLADTAGYALTDLDGV